MVTIAQLVRALDCGSRGRRFDPDQSPKKIKYFSGASETNRYCKV